MDKVKVLIELEFDAELKEIDKGISMRDMASMVAETMAEQARGSVKEERNAVVRSCGVSYLVDMKIGRYEPF